MGRLKPVVDVWAVVEQVQFQLLIYFTSVPAIHAKHLADAMGIVKWNAASNGGMTASMHDCSSFRTSHQSRDTYSIWFPQQFHSNTADNFVCVFVLFKSNQQLTPSNHTWSFCRKTPLIKRFRALLLDDCLSKNAINVFVGLTKLTDKKRTLHI
jgi:hypothetical protein